MRKDFALALAVTIITVAAALIGIRVFAPQLLGVPADLQLVQVSKEVVPFFDGIFREEDRESRGPFIEDPYIRRQKPFYPVDRSHGPHDLLGFRNDTIPNHPDIITIGDSQTYGSNATMAQSWPYQTKDHLGDNSIKVYNMAVHGWGATDYFEIFKKAVFFSPKVIIIAFYTGNDPADSYIRVYGDERWSDYRFNQELAESDYPEVNWPVPKDELEFARLSNGARVGFTPKLRHVSSVRHPAVQTAYEIMLAIANEIGKVARKERIPVVFTIIPTKELVFSKRLQHDRASMSQDYQMLVKDEEYRIAYLSTGLAKIDGCQYVDIVEELQEATFGNTPIYSSSADGHPVAAGYSVIARALSHAIKPILAPQQ